MKRKHRLFILATGVLYALLICLMPVQAAAAAGTSLNLTYRYENAAVGSVPVRAYRVATAAGTTYTYTPEMQKYSDISAVKLSGLTLKSEWSNAANTLAGEIAAKKLSPTVNKTTDEQGNLNFSDLQQGVYLIVSDAVTVDKTIYRFSPFLVIIGSDAITAQPKGEATTPSTESTAYKVVKRWADTGKESNRPQSVTVDILKNGQTYTTQTLSSANNWSYSWTAPKDGSTWQIAETNIAASYQVSVAQAGTAFTITNSIPTVPATTNPSGKLPQTGQLWWPVPLLACGGLVLFAIGWSVCNRKNKGNA
ncbi:MAG: Cna B-type domain-containing protein [Oscillospiraceae bacterium]|nr:Cna B-type domain-containing protein [Oscillospiraceae bacterium]MDD3260493.1 Cna B-type domain-containing protein [Oscillospiraceae bacterium]